MAEIILPPIPPRPAPAVRPTMSPEPETPGNRGVKVIMVQGPGAEPGSQPEPAEPLTVADGKGSNWVGTNVYEIGQTVEARTAVFTGGVEPVTYRYRFITQAANSDTWVNEAWTTTTNAENPSFYNITAAGQVKFQSQARDSSDPVAQVNSVAGSKTIEPQTIVGNISFLVNGVEAVNDAYSALVGSSINVDCVTAGGTATNETYSWTIRNGDATITGSTTNKTCDVQLGGAYPASVQVQCLVSSGNSSNSPQQKVLMVVLAESFSVGPILPA